MGREHQIPRDLREKVDRELEPGEHIEWLDMPVPRFFTERSVGAVLVGIPFTAFALCWTFFALGGNSEPGVFFSFSKGFALLGIPLILAGVFTLLSPLWAYREALLSRFRWRENFKGNEFPEYQASERGGEYSERTGRERRCTGDSRFRGVRYNWEAVIPMRPALLVPFLFPPFFMPPPNPKTARLFYHPRIDKSLKKYYS